MLKSLKQVKFTALQYIRNEDFKAQKLFLVQVYFVFLHCIYIYSV